MNTTHLILVGAGGLIGSIARYLTVISVDKKFNAAFPLGTLTVNIVGSFILGVILASLTRKAGLNADYWRIFLGTGFCGGFTTFSAFAVENFNLLEGKLSMIAVAYILASVVGGLLAVWAGFTLSRSIL
jgi:CrcB protein